MSAGAWCFLATVSLGLDNQCKDTLFTTHWYGKNDIQTFNSIPEVKANLKYCVKYNHRASCCHQTFESELVKYFDSWRRILNAKLARVAHYKTSVHDVRNTDSYTASSKSDLEQFYAAERAFVPVLQPSVHNDCFSAILTYVAGMMCFSCKPNWFEYVVVDDAAPPHIVKLRIDPSVCVQLWDRCMVFGKASKELELRILDSALAKQAKVGIESLYMFRDQQSLCDWAHVRIALHPFSLTTTADKEANAMAEDSRRLAAEDPPVLFLPRNYSRVSTQEPTAEESSQRRLEDLQFDVIAEGQASTFDLQWAKDVVGIAAIEASCLALLLSTAI
jgi:hypothetical protein